MKNIKFLFSFILFFKAILTQNFTYSPGFDSNILSKGFPTSDGTPWNDTDKYPVMTGDVNGDGLTDLVGFGINGPWVSLSSGFSFTTPVLWSTGYNAANGWTSYDTFPRAMGDFNGDGKCDIVGFAGGGTTVSLSSGTSFQAATQWINAFGNSQGFAGQSVYPRGAGDFNGDGKADVWAIDSTNMHVVLSSGSAFGTDTTWSTTWGSSSGWVDMNTFPRYPVDFNGDGKCDFMGIAKAGLSTGSSLSASYTTNGKFTISNGWSSQAADPRYFADFNGDKMADLIGFNSAGIYCQAATGTDLQNQATCYSYTSAGGSYLAIANSYKLFGDVDGDGRTDILSVTTNGNGIKVFLSGTSATSNRPRNSFLCEINL